MSTSNPYAPPRGTVRDMATEGGELAGRGARPICSRRGCRGARRWQARFARRASAASLRRSRRSVRASSREAAHRGKERCAWARRKETSACRVRLGCRRDRIGGNGPAGRRFTGNCREFDVARASKPVIRNPEQTQRTQRSGRDHRAFGADNHSDRATAGMSVRQRYSVFSLRSPCSP